MNIDKLKGDVIILRTKMFYILGLIMMFLAGIGSLYGKFIDGVSNGFVTFGLIVLLILIKILAIIYLKTKDNYYKKLIELQKERDDGNI